MEENLWRISFTLKLIGIELFVSDPDSPLTIDVPASQVKGRVIALNTMETTKIVDIQPLELA